MDTVLTFVGGILASPFWQVVLTTVGTALAADWKAFKSFQSYNEFAAYSWGLAAWRGAQGLVVGVVSGLSLPVIGEALKRIGAGVLVLSLVAGTAACAKANAVLVPTQTRVFEGISRIDAEVRKTCAAPQYAAPCTDIRPLVLELVNAGEAFSKSVLDQKPSGVADIISAGGRLAAKVKALPSGETAKLVIEIAKVIAEASAEIGG